MCSERQTEVTSCIEIVQNNFVSAINSILPQPLTNDQVVQLNSAPAWSLMSDPDNFTFIETSKGVIHRGFVHLLEFSCDIQQVSSIIVSTLSGLVDLLQKVVWRARCDDQLQAEEILEINFRSKRHRPPRTNSSQANALTRDQTRNRSTRSASLRSSKVPNEKWFVWVNDLYHYGDLFLIT